jgi:lysozyme family protein
MANSKIAIAATLIHEGGYVNNPNDAGHATNMGITQADMPNQDMKTLTVEQATDYYQEHYWKPLYGEINDQFVANKIFDMHVLFGVGSPTKVGAVTVLQKVLGLVTDGSFGPVTLLAVNAVQPFKLLMDYKIGLVNHAVAIVQAQPQDRVFFAGWVRRINS